LVRATLRARVVALLDGSRHASDGSEAACVRGAAYVHVVPADHVVAPGYHGQAARGLHWSGLECLRCTGVAHPPSLLCLWLRPRCVRVGCCRILHTNSLTGTLPSQMWTMPNLEFVCVQRCGPAW